MERSRDIRITIGPSKEYDPNEPLCLPKIDELNQQAGLQDYYCTGELHAGKFVKISRKGVMNLCETRVYTLAEGKSQVKYHSGKLNGTVRLTEQLGYTQYVSGMGSN